MSLFDKDIIEQETELEKFHNRVKKWIKNEFPSCFRYHYGNLDNVSESFNRSFEYPDTVSLFEKYGIYNPYFHAVWLANDGVLSEILISIIYTKEKTKTLNLPNYADKNIFLKMKISANQIEKIHLI